MATRPVVPRATGEGSVGTDEKHWGSGWMDETNTDAVMPVGNDNQIGASNKKWKEGHFEKLPGINEYLAESTGYGIVSGCEPTISGLTVTVGAGIVHLADGTRKEIAQTSITLDNADPTNPRIDLVYIDSTGAVSKVTGTASASPVVPDVPTGGISVCNATVKAGSENSIFSSKHLKLKDINDNVFYLFPQNNTHNGGAPGDCIIIKTNQHIVMIDAFLDQPENVINYLLSKGIYKVDMFFLTHYHNDHYGNIPAFMNQNAVDFSKCQWFLPRFGQGDDRDRPSVLAMFAGRDYTVINDDTVFQLEKNVTLTCFNISAADYQHYADNNITDTNQYSMQILVEHGDIASLFTGDGGAPTREWLYKKNDQRIKHVDLLKIGHHGLGDYGGGDTYGASMAFFRTLSPKFAVQSAPLVKLDVVNGETAGFLRMFHVKTFTNANGSIEFKSTPTTMMNISDECNLTALHTYNSQSIGVFVDASIDDTSVISDGSKDKPYKDIQTAINLCNTGDNNTTLRIYIAQGSYGDVSIRGGNIELIGDSFTIRNLYIYRACAVFNCAITCNNAEMMFCNGKIKKLTFNPTQSIQIKFANMEIETVIVNCDNLSTAAFDLKSSNLRFKTLTADLNNNALLSMLATTISMDSATLSNSPQLFGYNPQGKIDIYSLNHTNINSLYNTDKATIDSINIPSTRKRYGSTADRPTLTPVGFMYFDTTLSTLIIYTGSRWIRCDNGDAV